MTLTNNSNTIFTRKNHKFLWYLNVSKIWQKMPCEGPKIYIKLGHINFDLVLLNNWEKTRILICYSNMFTKKTLKRAKGIYKNLSILICFQFLLNKRKNSWILTYYTNIIAKFIKKLLVDPWTNKNSGHSDFFYSFWINE